MQNAKLKLKNDYGTLVITCTKQDVDSIVKCALQSGCRTLSHINEKGKKVRIAGKNRITWPDDREKFLSALAQLDFNL